MLAGRLSSREVERLRELTGDWAVDPFTFNGERRAFEVSQEWLDGHLDDPEEDIDLVLKACQVLTDAAAAGEGVPAEAGAAPVAGAEAGSFVLLFRFDEEPGAAEVFRRLLWHEAAYRVALSGDRENPRVSVGFRFLGEEEFFRRRQHVYWLRELAGRLYRGRPYEGSRVP